MYKKMTQEIEKQICDLYQQGLTMVKVSEQIGISITMIHHVIKNNNIKARSTYKLTKEQRNEIAKKYKEGKTMDELANEYKVCQNNIRNLLLAREVKTRSNKEAIRLKFPIKEDFFDTITEDSAYVLGLFMADGSIQKTPYGWRISIGLKYSDIELLEKIRIAMGCDNHKITIRESVTSGKYNRPEGYKLAIFSVNSNRLAEALIKHGITPNKTHTAKFSDELKFNHNAWRGVIDGDGSLQLHQNKYPSISLCGSKMLCEQFRDYVRSLTPCWAKVYPTKSIWGFSTSCNYAVTVVKELYQNCTIALPRKLKFAQEHFFNWRGQNNGLFHTKGRHYLTCNGKVQTIAEWARETGIKDSTIRARIKNGWSVEDALFTQGVEISLESHLQASASKIIDVQSK